MKPLGSMCKLYVDGIPTLAVGDYLRTSGGSCYLVAVMRPNRNRPARRHLTCIRSDPTKIEPDAKVHLLHWYKRQKRAPNTLRNIGENRQ
jgi:hypothetical protein